MVNFHQMVVSVTVLLLVQASICIQMQLIIIMNMHVSLTSTHIPALSPMKTIWTFQFNVLFPINLPALTNLLPLLWKAFSYTFPDNKQHSAVRTSGTAENAFVYVYVYLPSGLGGTAKLGLHYPLWELTGDSHIAHSGLSIMWIASLNFSILKVTSKSMSGLIPTFQNRGMGQS